MSTDKNTSSTVEPAKAAGKPEKTGNGGKTGKSRTFKMVMTLLAVAVLLISAAAFAAWYGWNNIILKGLAAPGPSLVQTTFVIAPGAGVGVIAARLEGNGLIGDARLFRLKARLAGEGVTLKAGEYSIAARASINDIFVQLQRGKIVQHAITIAEGLTTREVLDSIRNNAVLTGEITEVPPEGTLLPETYLVTRGSNRAALIGRMQGDMNKVLDSLWAKRDPDVPLASKEEAIILASIVEKETGRDGERAQVAAVFVNRLKRGMRLDSDPTIIYGLTGGAPLGRGLRRSEIDRKTAWNTYQINGLPPTPICNPGRDAIMAVLHPAQSKNLYFVTDGKGGHVFATSYKAHLRNVAVWRKIERQRKRAQR